MSAIKLPKIDKIETEDFVYYYDSTGPRRVTVGEILDKDRQCAASWIKAFALKQPRSHAVLHHVADAIARGEHDE